MGPGLIVLVIVVVISLLISVASNWLRNQQRQIEAAAAEKRARNRVVGGGSPPAGKAGAGDIDRFLEEINKLRQKSAERPDLTARPPRKAEPARSPKPSAPRRAEPAAPSVVASSLPRLEDLPVAPVVARPLSPPLVAAARPVVTKSASLTGPPTEFSRQFSGLLTNPKSLPMAILLQEVLGPPKSKRN